MCFIKEQLAKIPDAGTVSTVATEDSIVFVDLSKLLHFSAAPISGFSESSFETFNPWFPQTWSFAGALSALASKPPSQGWPLWAVELHDCAFDLVKIRATKHINNVFMKQCPPTVLSAGLHSWF